MGVRASELSYKFNVSATPPYFLRAEKIHHEPLMRTENLAFKWNSIVKSLNGEEQLTSVTIENVITKETEEITLDGLFISVGRSPVTSLFEGQIELQNGYIAAGEDTKTSLPGVFAAGDVRTKALHQIVTAAADGAVAAHFAEEYIATL